MTALSHADLLDRLFLTTKEAAAILRADPRTVRRGIEAGEIPAVHISTTVRIPTGPFLAACGLSPDDVLRRDDTATDEPSSNETDDEPVASVHRLGRASAGGPSPGDPAA